MKRKIKEIKEKINPILKEKRVASAGIFGSYARGEEKKGSDIDILVEFKDKSNLFDLVSLEILLKRKLKRKVDVLTYNSINPLLKKRMLKEEIKII